MLNRFRGKMTGRNGFDKISLVFIVIAVLLLFVFRFIHHPLIIVFALVFICLALARIFSKDPAARRAEAFRLTNIANDIKYAYLNRRFVRTQAKEYKFFTCPECKSQLRVPRGRGKINITCPHCGTKFSDKS